MESKFRIIFDVRIIIDTLSILMAIVDQLKWDYISENLLHVKVILPH